VEADDHDRVAMGLKLANAPPSPSFAVCCRSQRPAMRSSSSRLSSRPPLLLATVVLLLVAATAAVTAALPDALAINSRYALAPHIGLK